ncbi:unnamed protein product [Lymnaea stagnalis]|uniref:N-acetyltransferase domain-containing protein n=1 Tax=Lymnaea stagnalis TaxID=6523 RepID=A0AAV2HBL4_LYMST
MDEGDSLKIPDSSCRPTGMDLEQTEEGCWKQLCQELLSKNATDSFSDENNCFGRPGSQIDKKVEFKNKFGEKVCAVPVIVDFNRVLQLKMIKESNGVINGVSNRDLLHAVCGLYDISLPDMETDTIYNTVCAKWARTIVIVQELNDSISDMTDRNVKKKMKAKKCSSDSSEDKKSEDEDKPTENAWKDKVDEEEDIYKEDEETNYSAFIEVFSDTDEEEEDDDDDDDDEEQEDGPEENYTKGIHTFINASIERRKKRDECDCTVPASAIGIENRLLACATFEKKFIEHKERVVHLTLISVRPRYRSYKIGRYLLSKCVSPSVTGHYEAVVVHADNSAVEFFSKFGFSADVILNTKWTELADAFTNCTLMSYFPAFSGHSLLYTEVSKETDVDLYKIDQELDMWSKKSREAYQGQLSCAMKFRNEILQLKHIVVHSHHLRSLQKINKQNELLNKCLSGQESNKDLVHMGLKTATFVITSRLYVDQYLCYHLYMWINTFVITSICVSIPLLSPLYMYQYLCYHLYINAEIISKFIQGMEVDNSVNILYSVSSIVKASLPAGIHERFTAAIGQLQDPSMVTTLYYCGSLEKPDRLQHILNNGFSEEDFTCGEFGRGLYFSKYPSKAAQFSVLGKLLEAQVGLGQVETVMKYDRTRKAPSEGNDSIFTPGRLYRPGDEGRGAILCQEYVIFNVLQVLPLWLMSYSAYPNS